MKIKFNKLCRPRIRTEYARKGFYYMGANIFSELPVTARISESLFAFREILNNMFVEDVNMLII